MRTLSDGRQRRTRQEWQEILSRFERSGLSENRFCKDHRLTRKTFRTWPCSASRRWRCGVSTFPSKRA